MCWFYTGEEMLFSVVVLPSFVLLLFFSFWFLFIHVGENTQGSFFVILSFSPLCFSVVVLFYVRIV